MIKLYKMWMSNIQKNVEARKDNYTSIYYLSLNIIHEYN